jgi:hypothetical protein
MNAIPDATIIRDIMLSQRAQFPRSLSERTHQRRPRGLCAPTGPLADHRRREGPYHARGAQPGKLQALRKVTVRHRLQRVRASNHMATSLLALIEWWLENKMSPPPARMGKIYKGLIIDATMSAVTSV